MPPQGTALPGTSKIAPVLRSSEYGRPGFGTIPMCAARAARFCGEASTARFSCSACSVRSSSFCWVCSDWIRYAPSETAMLSSSCAAKISTRLPTVTTA